MTEFKADLHCHTNCSDGTLNPTEIIQLAHQLGLKGLSITDHDTIGAYSTAMPAAKLHGISLISGVEFSTMQRNVSVHLLAYSFSLDSPLINEFCMKHVERRIERNRQILSLLARHGMSISEDEIELSGLPLKDHSIGRPHIALAMLKKRYVSTIQEAFVQYIGEGKPCYASGNHFSVEETIDLIHQAKGLAIIAHPHLIENKNVVQDLLNMNFDGIEGYYGRFNRDQCERWVKIGKKKEWLITGGSDFHGDIKPTLPLGSSWVNEETFNILYNHFIKNQS